MRRSVRQSWVTLQTITGEKIRKAKEHDLDNCLTILQLTSEGSLLHSTFLVS